MNPTRFRGFASLPTAAPDKAAQELERRVRKQKFAGAVINGHHRGRYLNDKFFWPILECAETLGAPIYLHPTPPPEAVIAASYGGFSPSVTQMLAGPGWGWHIETAVHIIRIILGGVFDRYPKLQIVIGHLGEGLPFMFQRLDVMPRELTTLDRPITAYLRDNVHYTFSGFNFPAAFLDLLLELAASTASCSRPTIRINRWRRRALFWSNSRSAPPTGDASPTAMPSGYSSYRAD